MRCLFSLILSASALCLTGCATVALAPMEVARVKIDATYTAKSQDSRVQFLILHYTSDTFDVSLKTLTEGAVSSHYLVDINPPTVYQLVDESKRAFHAGVSRWGATAALNAASIGIEIVNLGDRKTPEGTVWFDYPEKQMDVVIALVKDIVKRHQIRADRILGHSDIAPGRKVDPGPLFPWQRLADAGFGRWPRAPLVDPPANFDAWLALSALGYALDNRPAAVVSFHHHFRGSEGEVLDDEDRRILSALTGSTR